MRSNLIFASFASLREIVSLKGAKLAKEEQVKPRKS